MLTPIAFKARFKTLLAVIALSLAPGLALTGCAKDPGAASRIGGPFQLVDQNGHPQDQRLLQGKWTAVFFGYTYCPDVCPTTLQTLGGATTMMGPKVQDFQVVFITVDPKRDTPGQLKDYLASASFPRGVIGLTGTPSQIAAAANDYKVYYQKSGSGADYSVDHSAAIYLMNPKGDFDSAIPFGLTAQQTRDQILKAMQLAG